MFHYIEGTIAELTPDSVCILTNGICFELFASKYTIASIKKGEHAKLYIVESIGDNFFELFGFSTRSEKQIFKMLLSVSGVGPKAAISILSYNTPDGLALAVMNNNEKALTAAPGIGKKIAQRVILELKDKLGGIGKTQDNNIPFVQFSPDLHSPLNDAISALLVLGYNQSDISHAVNKISVEGLDSGQIIKEVLKQMI